MVSAYLQRNVIKGDHRRFTKMHFAPKGFRSVTSNADVRSVNHGNMDSGNGDVE